MSKSIDYSFEVNRILNRKHVGISCVIPAFNEGKRISKVLDVVVSFPSFSEIVLINDGSSDNTLSVMNYYSQRNNKVKVVDIKNNKGKSNAVISGIQISKGEIICLIDADLVGLKYEYLYKMLYYILNKDFDMTILDRAGDRASPIGWAQSWTSRFNGGERAFWKKEFQRIPFEKNEGYLLEQVMNMHYVSNELRVRTIYCPELFITTQFEKKHLTEALKTYYKMFLQMYRYSKIKGFYLQVESIVEDRIEPLYKLLYKSKVKKPVIGAIAVAGLVTSIVTFAWLNFKKGVKRKP
ncbi:glycosyltransferase family 2 protein [bacterium]|nr:glycosyltransferase family 2 protein [bacterium]